MGKSTNETSKELQTGVYILMEKKNKLQTDVDRLRKKEDNLQKDLNMLMEEENKNKQCMQVLENKVVILKEIKKNASELEEVLTGESMSKIHNNYTSIKKILREINSLYVEKNKTSGENIFQTLRNHFDIKNHFPNYDIIEYTVAGINIHITSIKESIIKYNNILKKIGVEEEIIKHIDNIKEDYAVYTENIEYHLDQLKDYIKELSDIPSSMKKETYSEYLTSSKLKLENELSTFISEIEGFHKKISDAFNKFVKNTEDMFVTQANLRKIYDSIKKQDTNNKMSKAIIITDMKKTLKIKLEEIKDNIIKAKDNIKEGKEELLKVQKELKKVQEELNNYHLQGEKDSFVEYIESIIENSKSGSESRFLNLFKNNPIKTFFFLLIAIIIISCVFFALHLLFQYTHKRFKHYTDYKNIRERGAQRSNNTNPYNHQNTSNTGKKTKLLKSSHSNPMITNDDNLKKRW